MWTCDRNPDAGTSSRGPRGENASLAVWHGVTTPHCPPAMAGCCSTCREGWSFKPSLRCWGKPPRTHTPPVLQPRARALVCLCAALCPPEALVGDLAEGSSSDRNPDAGTSSRGPRGEKASLAVWHRVIKSEGDRFVTQGSIVSLRRQLTYPGGVITMMGGSLEGGIFNLWSEK